MTRWIAIVVVVVWAVALAATASAQPSSSSRAKAAARFKQGQTFFLARDYDHALVEYEAAYELSREPLLIFNIALCHDRANRPEQALAAFKRYLELAPGGEVADEAREDVVRLTAVVEAIHAREAAERERRAEQARREEAARVEAAAEQVRRALEHRAAERRALEQRSASLERRARIERWSGVAGAALGAVSFAVALRYGLEARSAASDITAHRGPWTDEILARDADGRAAERRMIVFTSVGGAVAVAGAAIYLLGRHHDGEARRLRIDLRATASAGSVAIAWRF